MNYSCRIITNMCPRDGYKAVMFNINKLGIYNVHDVILCIFQSIHVAHMMPYTGQQNTNIIVTGLTLWRCTALPLLPNLSVQFTWVFFFSHLILLGALTGSQSMIHFTWETNSSHSHKKLTLLLLLSASHKTLLKTIGKQSEISVILDIEQEPTGSSISNNDGQL